MKDKENHKSFLNPQSLINQIFNKVSPCLRTWSEGILITIDFSDYFLRIICPWRIEDEKKVLVGWSQNKDYFEDIQKLLGGKKILKINICEKTGDLTLYFEESIILRTFTHSSAFEQWHLEEKKSKAWIEAAGGGDILCCEGI